MADPRNVANRVGVGYEALTYGHDNTIVYDVTKVNGSAQVGLAASLESANVATLAGDGENILGKILKVEPGGAVVIQTGGFMTLPGGDGATLTVGTKIVGDLGVAAAEGYIRSVNTEHGVSRGRIEDATDATAVLVCLEKVS